MLRSGPMYRGERERRRKRRDRPPASPSREIILKGGFLLVLNSSMQYIINHDRFWSSPIMKFLVGAVPSPLRRVDFHGKTWQKVRLGMVAGF